MKRFADLHTHTRLCRHASGEPEEYLSVAAKRELAVMGMSDHTPYPVGYDSPWRMTPEEFPQYRQWAKELRAAAPRYGVEVLYGLEIDWVPGRMAEAETALKNESFDYLLGSVHYIGDFAFDNPDELARWREIGVDRVWARYAEELCGLVEYGKFNILSHPDLPKKFALYPSDRHAFLKRMEEVFHLAASKGIAMELNTSGLRKAVHEIYPAADLVRLAAQCGMFLTFGSDAHAPEEVGAGFDAAKELAESAGYRCAFFFRQGKPVELPFD